MCKCQGYLGLLVTSSFGLLKMVSFANDAQLFKNPVDFLAITLCVPSFIKVLLVAKRSVA